MKEENKNEELKSRRDFFRNVAKAALPILGAIALSNVPLISKATETELGCYMSGCTNGCMMGCTGCHSSCRDSCQLSCYSSCMDTCRGRCNNTCHGSCSGGCARSAYA